MESPRMDMKGAADETDYLLLYRPFPGDPGRVWPCGPGPWAGRWARSTGWPDSLARPRVRRTLGREIRLAISLRGGPSNAQSSTQAKACAINSVLSRMSALK